MDGTHLKDARLKVASVEIMIVPYTIDDESEADDYLQELLKKPEYRSMNEVLMRAQKNIKDAHLKNYFISKAKEILKKTYGHEIE